MHHINVWWKWKGGLAVGPMGALWTVFANFFQIEDNPQIKSLFVCLFVLKGTVKRKRESHREGENILKPISDKGLMSQMNKELLTLEKKETSQ